VAVVAAGTNSFEAESGIAASWMKLFETVVELAIGGWLDRWMGFRAGFRVFSE
jgi:hypothetical protein